MRRCNDRGGQCNRAGSVGIKDIPSGVFAAGNPCKVIRAITEQDSIQLKKSLF